jgi:hypothetical protein
VTQTHPENTLAHEARLQASRRIDWRFLLPAPDLGRVASISVTDAELLESLALFSARLDVADSTSGNGLVAPYDLVVLRNPRRELLETARGLLRSGGWLYVEVEASISSRDGDAPRSARGCAKQLRRMGLVDVDTYLHWPDFASCRAIIPLDDVAAVRHGLARGRMSGGRLLTRLAPVLAATRQLGLFVPCASAIGRRPGEDDAER